MRTLQRWKSRDGFAADDGRVDAARPTPANAPTPAGRQRILRIAEEPRFVDMPLAHIVPAQAERGVFIASESNSERVLRECRQICHCGRAKAQRPSRPPTSHVASAPRQLWCKAMTFLPALSGRWFYPYLALDARDCNIVGFEVHDADDPGHAAHLVKRTALTEGIRATPAKPRRQGDGA